VPDSSPRADNAAAAHFARKQPGWFTKNVFNRLLNGLMGLGFSVWGSRVLEVRGRKSGEPRRTPVNLLTVDGVRYLVAPRGETQWVRNLRAAGEGRLLLGRRGETFSAVELADVADKAPILRAYLKRWKAEVGVFFDGVGPDSSEPEMLAAAAKHPVFRLDA
jgi:deazaflavin-dependent oxidoreductase (nitroreductase family)